MHLRKPQHTTKKVGRVALFWPDALSRLSRQVLRCFTWPTGRMAQWYTKAL